MNKFEFKDRYCQIYFLDETTIFIAKILVGRKKDFTYCKEMIRRNLIQEEPVLKVLEANRNYLIEKYPDLNNNRIDLGLNRIKRLFEKYKLEKERNYETPFNRSF